ncbi:MAG: hypothetical protein IT361_06140 [Gemmatimonadaceae bacterium]|nr:hypothetical protein [Gemmatimonadaceae bacterium]
MLDVTYEVALTSQLRSHGLAGGCALVRITEDCVDLTGADGGKLSVRLDDIIRLRVGYLDGRSRSYESRLWRWEDPKPLRLVPLVATWREYGVATRDLAARLEQRGRRHCLEQGSSRADAIFGIVATGLIAIASVVISLVALEQEPWWGRLLVPVFPVCLFGLLLYMGVRRYWPRPINSLAELDVQLPPT